MTKKHRKYLLPSPAPRTGPVTPPEFVVLRLQRSVPAGAPVTPCSGLPAPETVTLQRRERKPDPHRLLVPSRSEIEALPRWARVAFAARCARRVLPLFRHAWPEAPVEHEVALRRAVAHAARSAVDRNCPDEVEVASPARNAVFWAKRDHDDAAEVAQAAEDAVNAAGVAASAVWAAHEECYPALVARSACSALARAATVGRAKIILSPRHDLDRLLRLAAEQKWTDDSPVPPEVFGPMWDREPPSWWREDLLEGMAEEGEATKSK